MTGPQPPTECPVNPQPAIFLPRPGLPCSVPCLSPPGPREERGSPVLEAGGVVGEAGAGRVDGLQLGEARGHWGAAREPAAAAATPGRHRRGIEEAALLLHLQTEGTAPPSVPRQWALLPSLPQQRTLRWARCPTLPRGCLAFPPPPPPATCPPHSSPPPLSSLLHFSSAHNS